MKALALTSIGKFDLLDIPRPQLQNPDDVLIAVKTVGICGSDVHYYTTGRIGEQVVEFPWIVGHECAGIVEAVGPQVAGLQPGDAVAIEPAISCCDCDQCNAGRPNTCRTIKFISAPTQAPGALQQYIVMPQRNCFLLKDPDLLPIAPFAEPLSIGLYTIERAPDITDKTIGILGSGPIGLSVLLALTLQNPGPVFVTDRIDSRLAAASAITDIQTANPDTTDIAEQLHHANPLGLDIVFECCGRQSALDQAFEILKPGGHLVIVGIPETRRIDFDVDVFRRKELSITYIRRQNNRLGRAVDLLESGRIDPTALITHRFTLEDAPRAFELLADYRDGVIKAMIDL